MGSLGVSEAVVLLIPIALYGVALWILWKFYHAFAKIGDELSESKTLLQDRLGGTERPPV